MSAAVPTAPLIFNIQRFCTHDGPGVRTVVFLKGCPLRCRWCSNPESQNLNMNILFSARKCIACGLCESACPSGIKHGKHGTGRGCRMCGACAAACPAKALEPDGRAYTPDELLAELGKDEAYYGAQGGVTISGGEPLMHPAFVRELARGVKACGYHLALETTGFSEWETAKSVFSEVDLLLYDIKHMDERAHKRLTGVSNRLILENAAKAVAMGCDIIARIPLIAGVNDDEENIMRTAEFCAQAGIKKAEFLPYHEFGRSKYEMLRQEYALKAEKPSLERRQALSSFFVDSGIDIVIGN